LPLPAYATQGPRSGLAHRDGLVLPNAPGTIDSDYRGEIQVLLWNTGEKAVELRRGDRIAHLVVSPVVHVEWADGEALGATPRGEGGFGHTGRGAAPAAPANPPADTADKEGDA
jgi:dUTP pyrophosphatase